MGKNISRRPIYESEGEAWMISELLNYLKSNERIHAWNVKVVTTHSHQLFFIKQNLDMNREVVVDEYYVTLYTKQEINGKEFIGTSSFRLYPSMSQEEIKEKIEEQIDLCKFTVNKPYSFPKKSNLKPVTKELKFDELSLKEAAFVAADALFEADKFDKGYINSSEVYINLIETRFFDSKGNIFLYTSEEGQIEFVATWAEKGQEVELYKFIRFDSLDSTFIQDQATQVLLEANNRFKAIKTPKINQCKVLLTGDYVKTFFLHFIDKCSTDAIYARASTVSVGMDFQKGAKGADKMSIKLEPTLKRSTVGAPFDDEGVALKRLSLIEKGVIRNLWGSNAKSQYLNKPVNGRYKNFVVGAGSLKKEELEDETYLEIISLSDFSINELTGDFGSEIRLAYYYQKNKERQIVTGGSISGNVYNCLSTVRFLNETKQNNNFIGPKKVLLENVTISSGE